jgi:predicted GIY-YIG superfamily endonuclease
MPNAPPPIIVGMGTFYVYIMASRSRVLYVGVPNDLARRTDETQATSGRRLHE